MRHVRQALIAVQGGGGACVLTVEASVISTAEISLPEPKSWGALWEIAPEPPPLSTAAGQSEGTL